MTFIEEPTLLQAVEDAVGDWSKLAVSAQQHLNELVLSIPNDDDAVGFAQGSLGTLTLTDSAAVKQLTLALSLRFISVRPSVFCDSEV